MQVIASMVLPGLPVADIGTDHGFIPAYLLAEGICPRAVLTDVNRGPLEKCKANLKELGIDPVLYDIRLGNGFEPLEAGEISTVIIAGMGGELIQSMFEAYPFAAESAEEGPGLFERAVLQPRTHADDLRGYLTQSGFKICAYRLARERGRICEVFAVEHCSPAMLKADTGLVSLYLLEHGDPLLAEFVDGKIARNRAVLESLKNSTLTESAQQRAIYNALNEQLLEIRKNI